MNHVPTSFLVLPSANDRTVAELQRKVHKVALRELLTFPAGRLSPRVRQGVSTLRRVLPSALKASPAAVQHVLSQPEVLTPLLVLALGEGATEHSPDALLSASCPALITGLSHFSRRGAVPEAILWDAPLDHLPDPLGNRVLRFGPAVRGALVDPLGLELNAHDEAKVRVQPGQQPGHASITVDAAYHPVHPDLPRLRLSTFDNNPLSMFEAHPDKDGNAISLGDKPLSQWLAMLHEGLELVRLGLPDWFEEAKTSMRRLVPVGYLPERHLSATYREAPGVAYLTLCDNPLTLAEALIHETQHTKINLLSWLDPIVHNAHTCWTTSPVRPDLRPLWGVLLAVHAFVPVAALHHRLAELDHPISRTPDFARRRAEVLAGNHRGMVGVREQSEPSPLGRRLIDEMGDLHDLLRSVAPPPPEGLDLPPDLLPPS